MDTNNNNSSSEMDVPENSDQQLQRQEEQPAEQVTIKTETPDPNPDRIELYVRYDASDMLRDESGTQTPIEDEPSQGTGESSTTTSTIAATTTNNNNDQEQETSTANKPEEEESNKTNKTRVIRVVESEEENSENIEIELEDDNSLLLTSLTSLFPDATGLKFRHPETNTLRGVKLVDGKFAEPLDGWSSVKNYICVFSRGTKRKADDETEGGKKTRLDSERTGPDGGSDLIVLGLPWTTTEETMRSYFEQYGEVVMVQVKTDPKSGKSRGFGFVRFAKASIQNKLLSMRHFIDGRWCDVGVPQTKAEADTAKAAQLSRKIFVGRLPDSITTEDLRSYFSEYGTLTDVFIPKPFRNFAFVTFGTSDMAQSIFKHKREHKINGTPVQISEAIPKNNPPSNYGGGGGGGYGSGPQPNASGYGAGGAGYVGNASNNIHPFNNSYGAHPAPYHHHGKNNVAGNFGGVYPNNRKMHQQSTYYQMPSYGSSGPSSGVDPASYANHADYGAFGTAATGYNQPSASVNGGQYYKMQQQQQQQQPVMTSNQNHSTYPNQSSYSNHGGANFSRGSYGSVWK